VRDRGDVTGQHIKLDVRLRFGWAGGFRNGRRRIGVARFLDVLHRIAGRAARGQQIAHCQTALARDNNTRDSVGDDEVACRTIGICGERRNDRLHLDARPAAHRVVSEEGLDGFIGHDLLTDRLELRDGIICYAAGKLLLHLVETRFGFVERS